MPILRPTSRNKSLTLRNDHFWYPLRTYCMRPATTRGSNDLRAIAAMHTKQMAHAGAEMHLSYLCEIQLMR